MAQPQALYRVEPGGVAVVTMSYPPLNALHPDREWQCVGWGGNVLAVAADCGRGGLRQGKEAASTRA